MIDESVVQRVIGTALRTGGDFAEVFAEDRRTSSALLDDGKVEELTSGRERGAGIRVVVGETTGFAHTADLSEVGLTAAAEAAAAAARSGGGGVRTVDFTRVSAPSPTEVRTLPELVAKADKVDLLRRADEAVRAAGGAIKQATASYADNRRRILVANSDGVWAEDDVVRTRFGINAVALGDGGMQTGSMSVGHTMGFELFDEYEIEELAREAARRALLKLRARPAPSGTMPVVIKSGGGAVLFHEACGHGLEADAVAKNATVFAGRVGEQVASPLVTLVDTGTSSGQWGSAAVDDEGHPAQRNVLIENGVLVEYMWDGLRARKEARDSSGNGRRESYKSLPMVRMTNTFLERGESDPDDIIRSTERGVYCAGLGGGSVNTATGDFVFGMTEAYLIEDGEVTEPIREGNLVGNGPEVLKHIDAVANDFDWGWPGMCGKQG
ncbi:MAG: TldD protein, partial [Acidimicrobiaceae bacterium]|nr:TldD protein [Acidimicrobiaceae bacterium]